MDYRQRAFEAKFASAGKHLGVDPDQVISLKLREVVSSYQEYQEMLHTLELEAGVHWSEVDGHLQGRGYLVHHDDEKLIVVEHETGLEILYIAGSLASLIGLIPLVLQCWSAIRHCSGRRHAQPPERVEIRRLDAGGRLCETCSPGPIGLSGFPAGVLTTALSAAARALDADVHALRKEVRSLDKRLTLVEERRKPKTSKTVRKATTKKRTGKSNRGAQ